MKDLKFFLALAQTDRWWLRLGAGLAALTLLASIGLLALSGWFITAATLAGLAGLGTAFNYLFASGGVRVFALTRTISRYGERMVTHEATFRILARLRLWVFDQAAPLAPAKLSKFRGGDLLSRVTSDVDALDNLYLRLVIPAFAAACGALATMFLLAFLAPAALPGIVLVFGFTGLVLPWMTAKAGAQAGAKAAQMSADARAEAADLAAGLAELKAFGGHTRSIARLDAANAGWLTAQRDLAKLGALNMAVLGFAGPLSFILGVLAANLAGASLPIAALAGFVAFGLFEAAAPLLTAAELYGRTTAAARRLRELDEIEAAVREPEHPKAMPDWSGLSFQNVSFTYPGTDQPVLDQINLELKPGAHMALTGPSGIGKSTLFKLLMGFYGIDSGQICLNTLPLSVFKHADIRAQFALVDQRAELLSGSVATNLRLAAPEADDDALWAALETARAADFVRALPDGLDTWIGERGGLLSGGQARRLVLARAILKDAPVLLLDEPTEGLDSNTEAEFMQALTAWLDADTSRTVMMITHRPALLDIADQIIPLGR